MARGYLLTEERISRLIKDGRGQGEGEEYQPWITIRDFSSKGRVTRTPGWKIKRLYHLMSDQEKNYFFILQWFDEIIDIREQYPILDREAAYSIATKKGIKYPISNGTPVVLTTDFLIAIRQNEQVKYLARTVKPSKYLASKRTIEKFEIEKCYWQSKGIDWGIVTEKELSKVIARNVNYLYSAYWLEGLPEFTEKDLLVLIEETKLRIMGSNLPLASFTTVLDKEFGVKPGTFLFVVRHLIARKKLRIDITKEFSPKLPTNQLMLGFN